MYPYILQCAYQRTLRDNPIQQLYRLTCLTQSMLDAVHADEVVPALKHVASEGRRDFQESPQRPRSQPGFLRAITMERLFEAIAFAEPPDHFDALYSRYGDWHQLVDKVKLYADQIHAQQDVTPLPNPEQKGA